MSINKVLFFCYGDSSIASTWSNVPFCFTKALEKKDIEVDRVDLNSNKTISNFYNYFIRKALKMLLGNSLYYNRTRLFQWLTKKKIKQVINKNSSADLAIFCCFDFYDESKRIPSLLFSDWDYITLLKNRLGRPAYNNEKRFIKQQREAIENADYVVPMFPSVTEDMKLRYPVANICFLGGNVINNLCKDNLTEKEILQKKLSSNKILFIGKADRYLESAKLVAEAVDTLRRENKELQLDLIGISRDQLKFYSDGIKCHGYLHKEDDTENKKYYDLLINAKVIVNPTPRWAAFSSVAEAMYFYTPVIITPYEDFMQLFGENISFGVYNQTFTRQAIIDSLNMIIHHENYLQLCQNAHQAVKNYTWDSYIEKMLNMIN